MKRLALFDFDGTITTKDSFLVFIQYTHGQLRFVLGMLCLLPVLIAYKLKLLPNWRAKELVIGWFWGGKKEGDLKEQGDAFGSEVLPNMCRPAALEQIRKYQQEGWRVVVVSASASLWLHSWANAMGVELIATELEVNQGRVTGRIAGKNCYGIEKVNRIKTLLQLEDYETIHAYGDSAGDAALLAIADTPFYKPFRA